MTKIRKISKFCCSTNNDQNDKNQKIFLLYVLWWRVKNCDLAIPWTTRQVQMCELYILWERENLHGHCFLVCQSRVTVCPSVIVEKNAIWNWILNYQKQGELIWQFLSHFGTFFHKLALSSQYGSSLLA